MLIHAVVFTAYANHAFFFIRAPSTTNPPPTTSQTHPKLRFSVGAIMQCARLMLPSPVHCERANLLRTEWGSGLPRLIRATQCQTLWHACPQCRYHCVKTYFTYCLQLRSHPNACRLIIALSLGACNPFFFC